MKQRQFTSQKEKVHSKTKKSTKVSMTTKNMNTKTRTLKKRSVNVASRSTAVSFNNNHVITDDSSYYSDTTHHNSTQWNQQTLPLSKLPKRIRIPTNFYHVASTTATTTTSRNGRSKTDVNHNDQHNNNMEQDTMPTLRPQRKRIPTEFFTPSATNPSRVTISIPIPSTNAKVSDSEPESLTPSSSSSTTSCSVMTNLPTNGAVRKKSNTMIANNSDTPSGSISYENLLADYGQRVTLGYCYPVSFGKTLSSAIVGIDRKLEHLQSRKCYTNWTEDPDVVADLREYKRSLRAFSVYEDREKLASIQEVQENLEWWGRQYANMTIPSKKHNRASDSSMDQNQIWNELLLLEKRPIVLASGTRMMSRSAFQCPNGHQCIFGCRQKMTTHDAKNGGTPTTNHAWTASKVLVAPIPRIEPFSMEDDDDEEDDPNTITAATTATSSSMTTVAMKTKHTIDVLRELKSSLQFIATYQDRDTYFTSLE